MAEHVPAFTQHTQLFHRSQKSKIHRHPSRNSMHSHGKNDATPTGLDKIITQNE